jgi:hypothetical protein
LTDVLVLNTQTLVQSFRKEHESGRRKDFLKDCEYDRDNLVREERRPVVRRCVNPSVKEVVVTVGKTFRCKEKVIGSFLVEFRAYVWSQWEPRDMEVSIFSLFDPVGPESALKTVSWPIPGVLGFNNVELTIKTKSHRVVANM